MSSANSPRGRKFRFGAFELDTQLGELRRSGVKLPLQGQPLQILEVLLLSPKQLVSREQLCRALWPEGTFVDFDDALNNCIRRLRQALNDDAEAPRFIETLPRRGYRFLADVEDVKNGDQVGPVKKEVIKQDAVAREAVWATNSRLRKLVRLFVPALLLALVVAAVSWYPTRSVHVLTDDDVIVLADFDNRTGEPVFDNTLRTALAIDLEQSPFLSVMPDLRMREILKQMQRAPGERVIPEIGREICLRTSSKALLAGSIASIGSHYALQLKATDCRTGKYLATAATEADSREKVLQSLGQAATSLRSKLGESLASVQKYDTPLEEATTSSLEALQAFSEGDRIFRQKGAADAIPFFQHAVELDPKFGYAYTNLGTMQGHTGETGLASENLTRGFELRDRLNAKERYMTAVAYYADVTGELEKAGQQIQLAAQEYPRDFYIRIRLGQHHRAFGHYEEAVAELREAVRLQPDNFLGYNNLGMSYLNLDRLDEAQAVLQEALSRKLDSPWMHTSLYRIAFLRNDAAGMQREMNWALGRPVDESFALLLESATQGYYGRLTRARKLNRAAVASALRDGRKESAAQLQAVGAIVEAEFGNSAQGRQTARAALALSQDGDTRWIAATALALSGDSGRAQRLLKALTTESSLDTRAQKYWLPEHRAQIELSKGHAHRALERLESTKPYDLKPPMYSVFLRGQAYLSAGEGGDAATEFQKILDHRGLVVNDVTGALAHLYLGRARALEARSLQGPAANDANAKARAAYQDFLTLWKDADLNIPILRQAKAEYVQLQ